MVMMDEPSEQSYTEFGNVESSYLDYRTGDFTETYREELPLPDVDAEAKEVQRLTEHEAKRLQCWKRVLVLGLLLLGALAVAGAYISVHQAQETHYLNAYYAIAFSAADSITSNAKNLFHAMQGLGASIAFAAEEQNQTFPFVTVRMFETFGQSSADQTMSSKVFWSPVIESSLRVGWDNYTAAHQNWVNQSQQLALSTSPSRQTRELSAISQHIFNFNFGPSGEMERNLAPTSEFYLPLWQIAPSPFDTELINSNGVGGSYLNLSFWLAARSARGGFISGIIPSNSSLQLAQIDIIEGEAIVDSPYSLFVEPIVASFQNQEVKVVGFAQTVIHWHHYVQSLVRNNSGDMYCVVQNSCGQSLTYLLQGYEATYLGEGDLHETQYDNTAVHVPFSNSSAALQVSCDYFFVLYSSGTFHSQSTSTLPLVVSICIGICVLAFLMSFLVYDHYVQRRNAVVADLATRSVKILSTLFPASVRERMFADDNDPDGTGAGRTRRTMGTTKNLKSYLDLVEDDNEDDEHLGYPGKPIADLFPDTTVMFADIAGFTAWSSVREPVQVFTLLETLYSAMDEIAKRRRVFKVETVGDCYVAVAGLPDPRKDHAVAMARFARDCMYRMRFLTRKLEATLGPDTGDLAMRAGLHSGPVTGGVLRGERSRFQLFGDTMNTASVMESTGSRGRIQISQETAYKLRGAGKANWCSPREEKVLVKGKGEVQTYWLCLDTYTDSAGSAGAAENDILSEHPEDSTHVSAIELLDEQRSLTISSDKITRLIDWNVDVLLRLLKLVVAFRKTQGKVAVRPSYGAPYEKKSPSGGATVISEVKEIIPLPQIDVSVAAFSSYHDDVESICLPPQVVEQLYDYVRNIAALYNDNPFHNFEHASHVAMSVAKLLSRIVAPSEADISGKTLHDHTYGITSDPLTQFACVFSALIHDVDHRGVPNMQLVKENTSLAEFYNNQSVAEQNSVDLAFCLLLDNSYKDLRRAIYVDETEYRRFRQLVVNSVMATDIIDKDLKALRNLRWAKAFTSEGELPEAAVDAVNRKATIVIEHLLQASDVAHTMQHWHIYRKWNERFFCECYKAYTEGRADKNPAEGWYQGELGFFDFYIVPLARKLKDCGVFGSASDEYLNYAVKNRREWENKGKEIVSEMLDKVKRELGVGSDEVVQNPPIVRDRVGSLGSTNHSLNATSHNRYGEH